MNRRAYLALCGTGLAPVAGCTAERPPESAATPRDDGTPNPEANVAEIGGAVPLGGRQFRLEDARLAEAVFLDHGAFVSIEREDGRQFVVADASWIDGSADRDRLSFALVVDGETHEPTFPPGLVEGRTTVALAAPVAPASEASVEVTDDGEAGVGSGETVGWRLGSDLVEALDSVPDFAVRDADVRATGGGGEGGASLSLAVENAGDRDGTFRALVAPEGAHDLDRPVAFDVPRGERVDREVPLPATEEPKSIGLTADWSPGTRRFEYGPA